LEGVVNLSDKRWGEDVWPAFVEWWREGKRTITYDWEEGFVEDIDFDGMWKKVSNHGNA
jgi:hypothetical protein